MPPSASSQSSARDLKIGRIKNLRYIADNKWLPPSASQISSLIDLDSTPPAAVSTPLLQTQLTARFQRNFRFLARFASSESSATPCRHSVAVPCRYHYRSHLHLTPHSSSSPSRSKIRVAFASRASLEESASSRTDYKWCNRDEQLRWLPRREQYSQLAEQCADAATSRKLLHRRVSRTTIAIVSRFA